MNVNLSEALSDIKLALKPIKNNKIEGEIITIINNLYEKAMIEWHDAGFNTGYEDGFNEGYHKGYADAKENS